ncbi:MAG: class I SAM-dependent methyltransferase [Alphaproteobacteria bacterium]|nr:class I SAM-dependent methyltransferase [Alphaproteobacteria bacterium]
MSDLNQWLERVYGAATTEENRSIYDDWADSYDADVSSGGYAYAPMAAGLFGRHVAPGETPVLDAGCGSGIIGAALARLGYANLTGIDLSDGMLRAAERKGVYRDLRQRVLGEPLDFDDGAFQAVVCTGVFTPGHAPPESLDELVRATAKDGVLIFCCTDAALSEGGFQAKIDALTGAGQWTLTDTAGPVTSLPQAAIRHEAMFFVYRR